jgi:energy-coupling factor transporter ATP-binding protein EcfA2
LRWRRRSVSGNACEVQRAANIPFTNFQSLQGKRALVTAVHSAVGRRSDPPSKPKIMILHESGAADVPNAVDNEALLSSITVRPGIQINPRGLILIVGPNSSGKTQLLRDIQAIVTGQARELVVCDDFVLNKPEKANDLLDSLISAGYLRIENREDGVPFIRQTAPHLGGSPFKSHNVHMSNVDIWFKKIPDNGGGRRHLLPVQFLDLVGHCLTTALFLGNRLVLSNETSQFDYASQPPNNDLQALYLNKEAKRKLTEETERVFGKAVWLDNSRGGILCLRVNQSAAVPSAEDRQEPEEMTKYRQIETEGDGLKSYVGICIALLLGRRPLCLIDEPELCLHPPQASAMGRFIGRYGSSASQATFVSTHSSHVLRGVMETAESLQILRLTKEGNTFKGHMISNEVLREAVQRPIVRTETILDGVFANAITIVEAEGDRAVYEAALAGLKSVDPGMVIESSQRPGDIVFIPVGGTGGIVDIAGFYRRLRIPVAIVADLDLLMDLDKLTRILNIACDPNTSRDLLTRCRQVGDEIKRCPPTMAQEDVKESLRTLALRRVEWEKGDDITLKAELRGLAAKIDRMRRLKNGGVAAFKEQPVIQAQLEYIVARLRAIGLLLVPVGELEHWLPELMSGTSKEKKAEWANVAAMKVRDTPSEAKELIKFIKDMVAFHLAEAHRMS